MKTNETSFIKNYVNKQVRTLNSLDEVGDKKGIAAQKAKEHKKGYMEALENVLKVIDIVEKK